MSVPLLICMKLFAVTSLAVSSWPPADASVSEVQGVYAPYQQLLDRYLVEKQLPDGGLVSAFDYRAALASDETLALLTDQRGRLARFETEGLESRARALAFWVNAYNYFMLDYILRNPDDGQPVESVRDYGNLFNPYAVFERKLFNVGGRAYSLQEIELEVLLGDEFAERGWKDARIHFMVNCASVGCPALRAGVYTAENMDAMLAENTRLALDTSLHLERDGSALRLTSLFDWYAADFVEQSGSVGDFIREHGSERARENLEASESIEFIDYDWALNTPENFARVLQAAGVDPFKFGVSGARPTDRAR